MRWRLTLLASAALLAGCTPVAEPAPESTLVPHELIQQWAQSCAFSVPTDGLTGTFSWSVGSGSPTVTPELPTAENLTYAEGVVECLNRYQYEEKSSLAFVPAYERAQLYDYYVSHTRPCLAARGVEVPDVPRAQFFFSDRRYWNPYPELDLPFDELLSLYRACPPVPDYVLSRHVTSPTG